MSLFGNSFPESKRFTVNSATVSFALLAFQTIVKAEAILRASTPGAEKLEVISNAAWKAPSGTLSAMFQAGAVIELFGDVETAFEIYYENYDIHSLPPLK